MKTNPYSVPWEENPEDQIIGDNNFSKAKNQLKRDVLRFMELFPDIQMSKNVLFKCYVAFPLVKNSDTSEKDQSILLTKHDFLNSESLLEKIGFHSHEEPSENAMGLLKRVLGRYVGCHSTIPLKKPSELLSESELKMSQEMRKLETAFRSQINQIEGETNSLEEENLKQALAKDSFMSKVLAAIQDGGYKKKFKKDYPGIPIDDLSKETDKSKHLVKNKSGLHPIFGDEATKLVLEHTDVKSNHKGKEAIAKQLAKDKIIFYLKDDKEEDFKMQDVSTVQEILNIECSACQLVAKNKSSERLALLKKEEDIKEALAYADQLHRGRISTIIYLSRND